MENPLVSVIMPAYNGEKYIGEAIDSIIAQSYQDWELIIVEDCSTDRTLTVIENYLMDSRIRLFQNEQNLGIAASRNRAIELSLGKYIAIQDDDDVSFPERLEEQARFLEEHADMDAVAGHWLIVDETGNEVLAMQSAYKNPNYVRAHLLFSDCVGNGSAMFRKDFVQKKGLRYQNGMLGMEDFLFWIEFSKAGNISAIDRIVYKHRKHPDQEGEKNILNNVQERRELFAWLQRESLRLSGITLSPFASTVLERLAGEKTDPEIQASDYTELYKAFREIIDKAYAVNLDYADEIAIACRKHLGKKIANSKGFWN